MIIVLLAIIGSSLIMDFVYSQNNMVVSTMTITEKSDSSGFYKLKSMGGDWYITKQPVYNKVQIGKTYALKVDTMRAPNKMIVEVM
jgi:hypothetical protein